MADLFALKGKTAVVTGAASGIGRAVAVSLARRGCDLALADVNEVGLKEIQAELTGLVQVSRYRLDVGDPEAVAAFPAAVLARHPGVDVLVNNAGVALGGQFDQVAAADFAWLFGINFWGVVNMTRAFLPLLKASPEARLVNVSSVFGLIAPPGQTAYCASKFAVRGFSESLRHELKPTRVGVTVVHPGGVATSIARSARMPAGASNAEVEQAHRTADAMLKLPPAVAGEIIVKGIERRRPRVLVGGDAKFLATLERLAPVSYWKWLGPRLRR
jgi:NAD(P)-dependent dehydrogenase (short-subunit alcohol dehydrogenase family)